MDRVKVFHSFTREAWVIPNGYEDQLWTDQVFDTEADAQRQVDEVWTRYGMKGPKHKPIKATVRLRAAIDLALVAGARSAETSGLGSSDRQNGRETATPNPSPLPDTQED